MSFLLSVVLAVSVGGAGALSGEDPGPVEGPNLSGEWQLNEELSEDPREKMRQKMRAGGQRGGAGGRQRGGSAGFGGGGRSGGAAGVGTGGSGAGGSGGAGRSGVGGPGNQPGGVRGVGQSSRGQGGPRGPGGRGFQEITIVHGGTSFAVTDAEGHTRTVQTNWKKWREVRNGEVRTFWKKQGFVVERRPEGGAKTTSRYTLNADGQLVVSITINTERMGPVTFDRVYDRVSDEGEAAG